MKKMVYIKGMSVKKSSLEDKMAQFGKQIEMHIAKCAMYGDSLEFGKYDHWISEIANWISDINQIYVKPSNKKLKNIKQYRKGRRHDLRKMLLCFRMNLMKFSQT